MMLLSTNSQRRYRSFEAGLMLTATLSFLAAGCDGAVVPEPDPPPFVVDYDTPYSASFVQLPFETNLPVEEGTSIEAGGLIISGRSYTSEVWGYGVMVVWSSVSVENRSSEPIVVSTREMCELTVKIYDAPEREGDPLTVSDTSRCEHGTIRNTTIDVGAAVEFTAPANVVGLTDGRHYVSTTLNLESGSIELEAGSVDWYHTWPNIAYHVALSLTEGPPDSIHTSLSLENLNANAVPIAWGCFSFNILAYEAPHRQGDPVYDWLESQEGAHCGGSPRFDGAEVTLAPSEVLSHRLLQAAFPVQQVLGESRPEGVYHFDLVFRQNVILKRDFVFPLAGVNIRRR